MEVYNNNESTSNLYNDNWYLLLCIIECVYTTLVLDSVKIDVGTVVLPSGLILSPLLLDGLGSNKMPSRLWENQCNTGYENIEPNGT